MLCGCHYKIFANLEWAFEMRKGVINFVFDLLFYLFYT